METFLLSLLLLPLSLYLISFLRKKGSDDLKNLPPGCNGWLRENLALALFGYQKFVQDRMQKYSPAEVFKTSLLGEKTAVFCGAQGNKFLFTNENKLVTVWFPPSLRKALLPEFIRSNYKEPSTIFHSSDITKPESLKQYIPVMDGVARRRLADDGWRRNSVVKVLPSSKKYAFELAFRLFVNVVDPELVDKLIEPFSVLSNGLTSLPIDLPGTDFNRAVKAGKVVRGELMRVVKETRKELREKGEVEGRDMLSKMLLLCDEDDGYDSKVASFMVGLIVVSFDTTASAITIVMNFLAQLPHIYEEVLKGKNHTPLSLSLSLF